MTERAVRYGLHKAAQKGGWNYGTHHESGFSRCADGYYKNIVRRAG